MKQLLRLSALVLSLLAGDMASAQCTPVDCLSSLPPFGGVCPGDLPEGRVNVAYNASLSFHVTNECFAATLLDPTLTGVGVRITQLNTFTFSNLPAGLSGATSAPTYAPPANGCASVLGTPTEAGVFDATIGILANVVAYPFSLACGGFSVNQNGNAIDEVRVITILPDPTFTGVSGAYCVTDGAVALTATGTPGGEFSGPGVVGSTFDPALAGVGNHSITYTVSAQQGAAVAPATDSFTIVVEVNDACIGTCDALAGTLTATGEPCLLDGEATLTATADGNAVVPAGYQTVYVLTEGAGLVIINAGPSPEFTVDAVGTYTIHTLVYDPNTLDLSIVELGVTTGFDVNGLLIQGGGTICASLDVAGAPFTVEACVVTCDALAGTLTADGEPCLLDGAATLTATADGNAVVPAGYQTVYVLTEGAGLVIINAGPSPEFTVDAVGTYTIHTLVYDPNTLDLGIVELGVTTGFDVNGLLIQGGGTICASLDVAGAPFTVEACVVTCDALAGTLTADGEPCLLDGAATLTATADGNAVVPAGYQTVYVLTEGAGLVIINAGPSPEFTVDAVGTYTIHTLVYDPNTLDLSIVELGVTTGFDVNGLLIQGGGTICASLDVAGAPFTVEACVVTCDALAGTLTADGEPCLLDGAATLTATADGNAVVPAGYQTVYVLTEGAGLVIINAGPSPEFTVDAVGTYTIHTLVYDPNTLDLGIVELGVTTGFDVNGLLIQGGGTICASLDVAGAPFTVEACVVTCDALAGTLTADGEPCLLDGAATLTATADGNAVVPPGYQVVYALTSGPGLVIIAGNTTPEFTVDAEGDYTIHTLVYDPNTLDLSIVEFGVTTGFDVNSLLIQGGGTICASLDVAGAAFSVELCCDAVAGTLSGGGVACFEDGAATLTATPDGNAEVPAGFQTVYVLTEGAGLVIINAGATPEFTVDAEGDYTIHTLVYDPNTLDLGIVEFGVTTGFDVNGLLIQGGGTICASLDVAGAAFTVELCCDAVAGTLSGGGVACFEDGAATLTATPDGNAFVPAGYQTVYVLTEGAGLVIINAGATPEFTVDAEGDYTIHTLVYDPNTLDLGIVEFGVTTGFDVNGLLIQGGGTICASLDVAGAAFTVELCCDAVAGTLSGGGVACFEDGAATLTATPDGNAFVPAGYQTVYVLTEGAGLVIINAGATPEFTVDAEGDYTIHTLVYDPNTLDLGIVEFGVTTGFDVNSLLIQGGGTICASLDVAGAAFTVEACTPTGYCTAGATSTSFEKIANVTVAGINNSSTATAGYEDFTAVVGTMAQDGLYPITVTLVNPFESDEVLVWIDFDQNQQFDASELVYSSPLGEGPHSGTITVPLGASLGNTIMRVRLHDTAAGANDTPCGTSTYGQVEDYTINIIEALPPCEAVAGTLTADPIDCLESIGALLNISASPDGNAIVPAGYSTVYVLTQGAGLVIVDAGGTPSFDVDENGVYTIHTLVYDPTTLDLGIVEFGVTTGFDVNSLLIQGGGLICASLDVAGAAFDIELCCDAVAGTLSGGGVVCFEDGAATLTATPDGNAEVPAGYQTVYVLTEGAGLVIINAGATPEFTVDAEGDYTIHTLVYDPNTLDLGIVEFGVTTGFDVNGLLIQGGGTICASLDVAGAAYQVAVCGVYCTAGATSLSFEKIANVTFADIDNSSTATDGYEDFTAVVGNVSRGSAYDINVDISDPFETDELLVWIDYDQNGVFSANELAYNSAIAEGPYSGSITIPVDAALGETRMRVRLHDTAAGANATPCGTSTFGQVEDYTIDIDVSTGLGETSTIATSVFPNPNMGDFSVRYGADATVVLELMDMSGRLVYTEQRATTSTEVMQLSLAGRLAPGTYILRMNSDLGRSEQRIVVGQ